MSEPVVQVAPARYVTVELAAAIAGLSAAATRKRIERAVWIEGRECRRGPDGRIRADIKGVERWVEAGSG